MEKILLNVESKETRAAYLKEGQLQDLLIERKASRQITGNIYRGEVTNILHNIQSAFIDIGERENGFIHISDILENTEKFENIFDMDFCAKASPEEQKNKNIDQLLQPHQPVLVQVVKEPIGNKGARLTSNVSVAGRYLVLLPNMPHKGVSRKIEDKASRDRLKKLLHAFEMPKDIGLICRTASANASTEDLIKEANELFNSWVEIVDKFHKSDRPNCLYEESDILKRTVIAAVDKKYDQVLIDDYPTFQKCKEIYKKYEAEYPLKIEFYRDTTPMFERFNIEKEIDRALKRKLWLNCGGYIIFERTEAMHTIDVNSGRSIPSMALNNVEEALVRINLEAAEEIARQLRIRNIGGLVICDFIDMRFKKNQKRVLHHLNECMKDDSAKCTILGMSEFGLVEMTRQRSRESLEQMIYRDCPYCLGKGFIKTHESVSLEIERALKKIVNMDSFKKIKLTTHPDLNNYLKQEEDRDFYLNMTRQAHITLDFDTNDILHLNDFKFTSDNEIINI